MIFRAVGSLCFFIVFYFEDKNFFFSHFPPFAVSGNFYFDVFLGVQIQY